MTMDDKWKVLAVVLIWLILMVLESRSDSEY
nr:MAG TPA: chitin synthase regulator [Caudoviricetes sp.]